MNEEQTALLADLLKVAIKNIEKDVKLLARKLFELRLLKAKKFKRLLMKSKFSCHQQGVSKSTLKAANAFAALLQQGDTFQLPIECKKPSPIVVNFINDLTLPTGESKELNAAKLMAIQAKLRLAEGDLVGAAALVFKAQRIVATEVNRLTVAALSEKAAGKRKTQDAKHAPKRKVKQAVLDHWEQIKDKGKAGFESKRRAGETYAAMLYRGELIGEKYTISARTISEDWL